MFLKRKLLPRPMGFGWGGALLLLLFTLPVMAHAEDGLPTGDHRTDTLPYPIHESRSGSLISGPTRSLDLKNPANITDSVAYDFNTHLYTGFEKIGDKYYKTPTTYTSRNTGSSATNNWNPIISRKGPTPSTC